MSLGQGSAWPNRSLRSQAPIAATPRTVARWWSRRDAKWPKTSSNSPSPGPSQERLPDWAPGAHIDIVLPDGTTRQYSLVGDRWDAHSFTIAVLRERDGRGGSEYIHTRLAEGDEVGFGGPRNNFRLSPAAGYLFIAGGIGITPIMPMIRQAELLGDPGA